jgi:hypothetical protein
MFVRIYGKVGESISQTFEAFIEGVGSWEGMYAEPDGSWVWVYHQEGKRYQLDGMLYDQAGAIEYVEIKGQATKEAWDKICNLLLADFQRTGPDAPAVHLRVHDIEQQCWRSPSDPALLDS